MALTAQPPEIPSGERLAGLAIAPSEPAGSHVIELEDDMTEEEEDLDQVGEFELIGDMQQAADG